MNGESDNIWNPEPRWFQNDQLPNCVRDPDVHDIVIGKPDNCPFGESYYVTKGKRKIQLVNCFSDS